MAYSELTNDRIHGTTNRFFVLNTKNDPKQIKDMYENLQEGQNTALALYKELIDKINTVVETTNTAEE